MWDEVLLFFVPFRSQFFLRSLFSGERQWPFGPLVSHTSIHVRQTDKLRFISPQILGSKSDRQTSYVSFHHSNLDPRKIDRRTKYVSFHPSILDPRETDKFHFISPLIIGIQVRQTDGQTVSFHSSYLDPRKTDRRKNFISPR